MTARNTKLTTTRFPGCLAADRLADRRVDRRADRLADHPAATAYLKFQKKHSNG